MNQIIVLKQGNKLHKRFFKTQLIVSILAVMALCGYQFGKKRKEAEMEQVSVLLNQAFRLETVYTVQRSSQEISNEQNRYFATIKIPKINLEYSVFNECNDELLKILPCRFYGAELGEKGNICIAGHNYEDERFFGQLSQLKKGDRIYLEEREGTTYQYVVYEKYKVKPDDFTCLEPMRKYDLTLVTCDNLNQKRWIIRASR